MSEMVDFLRLLPFFKKYMVGPHNFGKILFCVVIGFELDVAISYFF